MYTVKVWIYTVKVYACIVYIVGGYRVWIYVDVYALEFVNRLLPLANLSGTSSVT